MKNNGEVVGADCTDYAVLNPKYKFDTATLSQQTTNDQFEIVLAKFLGQKLYRMGFEFSKVLATPDSTDPIDFSKIDANIKGAAAVAKTYNVTLEMQITGYDFEKAMIANGTYEKRLHEVIDHYKNDIKYWEAWNEPTTKGWGVASFTENGLKPLYRAAKQVSADMKVVAGGLAGPFDNFVQGIFDNGGGNSFDILGVHPYVGYNRSVEQQDLKGTLLGIRQVLDKNGRKDAAIWDTESGFAASGAMSYYTQGDRLIRKHMIQESIGIDKHNNFFNIGAKKVDGANWSLIHPGGIKPGALASINWANMMGEGTFEKMFSVDIPRTYVAQYKGTPVNDKTLAFWTEDFDTDIQVLFSKDTSFTVTDQWGREKNYQTTDKSAVFSINGMVRYLGIPAGVALTKVQSPQSLGPNFARTLPNVSVTASSTGTLRGFTYAPEHVIDGVTDMEGRPSIFSADNSLWFQSETDNNPWLQLTLPSAVTLNRIFISSEDLAGFQSGLRSYTVDVKTSSGWKTVIQAKNEFFDRNHFHTFASVANVSAVRIYNMTANFSGYEGGLKRDVYGTVSRAAIFEVELYGPTSSTVPTVSPTLAPTIAPTPTKTVLPTATPTSTPIVVPTKNSDSYSYSRKNSDSNSGSNGDTDENRNCDRHANTITHCDSNKNTGEDPDENTNPYTYAQRN